MGQDNFTSRRAETETIDTLRAQLDEAVALLRRAFAWQPMEPGSNLMRGTMNTALETAYDARSFLARLDANTPSALACPRCHIEEWHGGRARGFVEPNGRGGYTACEHPWHDKAGSK